MTEPKICSIPLRNTGTHETIVLVVDGVAKSVRTWNFIEAENGDRTFSLEGITDWQLHIKADSKVQVIR